MRGVLRFKQVHLLMFCLLAILSNGFLYAQAPPDEAHAYAVGPTGVAIEFTACQTSDALNCYLDFSIYRNPPGFDKSPVWASSIDANLASHTIYDTGVKASQSYTYQVCAGGYANKSASNCIHTNAVTTPKPPTNPPAGNSGGGNQGDGNNGRSVYAPPTDLRAMAAGSSVYLKWTNPPQYAFPATITILRDLPGATVYQSLKELNRKEAAYTDSGPLIPHQTYEYAVCEGSPVPLMNNCVLSKVIVAWGADPILTATRVNPTTVRLSVAVDNIYSLYSISVTRQGSDDPCRQGTTLGNGEQGCRTPSIGGNGVPVNAPINVTVYQHAGDWGSNSPAAPWVIDIPDDTVKPGVEYYYIAHVTWIGPWSQDSAVVTAPARTFLESPIRVKSLASENIKPIHPSPTPRSARRGHAVVSSRFQTMVSQNVTLDSAIAAVKQKPGDAESLYSLGQVYCARRSKNTCVSLMYMGLLQANKSGDTALAARIEQSLGQQGVALSGVR